MKTRVYSYGILPPTENAALVSEQMRKAHEYRNKLVEIERKRRQEARTTISGATNVQSCESEVHALKRAQSEIQSAINKHHATERTRKTPEHMRLQLKEARRLLREARARLFAERKKIRTDPRLVEDLDQTNDKAATDQRAARGESGVYWGTYLLAEAQIDEARKTPLYKGVDAWDPRFVRWDGRGSVSVQIQKGMPAAKVFRDDRRVRVDPAELERSWWSQSRSEQRRYARTTLRIRIDSDGRDPIWATFPMIMHRPLPEGASVKRVTVHRRMIGPRERWTVDFTVQLDDDWADGKLGSGVVALDIGWRQIDDELRVCMGAASDWTRPELRLDARLISSFRKASELRATRDSNQNEMATWMLAWLKENALPDWLTEATRNAHQWRSPRRWVALANNWRAARFDGDKEAFEYLDGWRYQDDHLWRWESSQRSKTHGHRRHIYRNFAAALAEKYAILVLEDFDLSYVSTKGSTDNDSARSNRFLAATSELRDALVNAFSRRGGQVIFVDPAYTTLTCSACGHVDSFDAAAKVTHTCTACGAVWDQDYNAGLNLLQRFERRGDERKVATARKGKKGAETEKKWERVRRLREEKGARRGTARGSSDKAAE